MTAPAGTDQGSTSEGDPVFQSVHHVGVTVSNLERSVDFYRDVIGCHLIGQKEAIGEYVATITAMPDAHLRIALLEMPGSAVRLELIQYVTPEGRQSTPPTCDLGSAHVCFQVADIDATIEHLRDNGVTIRSQPVTSPDGPNRGARAVYVDDPDGITLELLQPPADDR